METPILYNKSENLITLIKVESKVCKSVLPEVKDSESLFWYPNKNPEFPTTLLLSKASTIMALVKYFWSLTNTVCKEVGAYASVTFSPILTSSLKQRFKDFLKGKGSVETQSVSPVSQNLFSACKHGYVNISFVFPPHYTPLTPRSINGNYACITSTE